ncbi:MAG: FkbM family methyltransferase [Desulfovibrionaceae bacterium]
MDETRIRAGEFSREADRRLDEGRLAAALLDGRGPGVMVDVGAHHGGSAKPFLERGWTVHAFEPDPDNRAVLQRLWGAHPNIRIDPRAVGERASAAADFYASDESTGISGLSAFTPGHRRIGAVEVVRLDQVLAERGVTRVDFLKIDTEGFDLFVLRGFDWETLRPAAVLCEFDDAKTVPLGYGFHDLAGFLAARGYHVLVSEWHPIVRYGIPHQFRRLADYPSVLANPAAWGNLLALAEPPDEARLAEALRGLLA